LKNKVKTLEEHCLEMADKCEDLMGKYESMLRRTTQVEMSVGILRSVMIFAGFLSFSF